MTGLKPRAPNRAARLLPRRWLAAAALLVLAACTNNTMPPLAEDLNGLRVLGAMATPLVPELVASTSSGTTAVINVYAAVPVGQEVTLTPSAATGAHLIEASAMTVGTAIYVEHSSFRLATIPITVPVPELSAFKASGTAATASASGTASTSTGASSGTGSGTTTVGGSVNYAFTLSTSDQSVAATGSFLAYEAGSSNLSLAVPTVSVSSPSTSASISGANLALSFTQGASEVATVSWFVGAGEVKDRHAATTQWFPKAKGVQSIIGTVRTGTSYGFALQVVDVDVE